MLRMLLVLITFAGGVTVGLMDAVIASCFFIWNDIFRPAAWARYYGVLGPSTFYPAHICTVVLALSILLRPWKRRWNAGATVLLVSLGWFFVCALCAQYRDIAIDRTVMSVKYFVPLALISATLCTRKAQKLFLYTLAGSVGIWLAHHGLLAIVRNQPITDMSIPAGQMTDRNDFLVAGTACVPMMIYGAFWYEGRWQRWIRYGIRAAVVFSLVAVTFSLSRGAILGFAALLCWFAFLTGRFFRRVALCSLIAVVAVVLMPNFVWERISTIETSGEQTEGSAKNRVHHMITAIKVSLDYPLTGVGADNFPPVSFRYATSNADPFAEPHSLWLKCSAEYGLPMLVFFFLVVALFLLRLRRRAILMRALGDRDGEAMATALSCALFGFLATGSFTSQFVSEYLWAIIGLIGAFLATPVETPATETPPPAPLLEAATQRAA